VLTVDDLEEADDATSGYYGMPRPSAATCSSVSADESAKNPVATPTTMPAITHVAVTVTDLERSADWYNRVLGVKPVLDEDTGPFRHIV
jgi:catechol-2,3-dioxygenase